MEGWGVRELDVGVAQNSKARVTQVLVFGSIYQGAILVHFCEPQPFEVCTLLLADCRDWS